MAYIAAINETATSFDVWIYGMDEGYSAATRTCVTALELNGVTVATKNSSISNQVSEDYITSFSGLTPSTTYSITCVVTYQAGDSYPTVTFTTTATTSEASVDPWNWITTNGPEYEASADDTIKAYSAITNRGLLTDFSHLVWNDLVYKTNQVVEDRGDSWDATYGSLSATLMISDYSITAARFNAVWYNIERYASTGISSAMVAGESPILGSYFTALATALNNAIGVE